MSRLPSRLPAAGLFLGLGLLPALVSCQSDPGAIALMDLRRIHDEEDWSPRSPAQLRLRPEEYGQGGIEVRGLQVGELPWYEIEDHEALELAILDRINQIPAQRLDLALEASAWLIIELLHDPSPPARIKSAAILSRFAGWWVEAGGVRLDQRSRNGDLATAVQAWMQAIEAIDDPAQVDRVAEALDRIDAAAIGDPLIAARLLAGMARRYDDAPLPATGDTILMRTGLRAVLMALDQGARDPDPEVAHACRVRADLIRDYLQRRP